MDEQMLDYILRGTDCNLQIYIQEVLDDQLDSPEHSAVYTSNMIKCYIKLMNETGNILPFDDVKGYLLYNGFSKQEYERFESSRKKEAEYYKGIQF